MGHKINAQTITDVNRIPDEWFLNISDLNNEKCKKYMDEEQRKKMLHNMLTNMVAELSLQRQKDGAKGEDTPPKKTKRHNGGYVSLNDEEHNSKH
jgi:hypothetical protein